MKNSFHGAIKIEEAWVGVVNGEASLWLRPLDSRHTVHKRNWKTYKTLIFIFSIFSFVLWTAEKFAYRFASEKFSFLLKVRLRFVSVCLWIEWSSFLRDCLAGVGKLKRRKEKWMKIGRKNGRNVFRHTLPNKAEINLISNGKQTEKATMEVFVTDL